MRRIGTGTIRSIGDLERQRVPFVTVTGALDHSTAAGGGQRRCQADPQADETLGGRRGPPRHSPYSARSAAALPGWRRLAALSEAAEAFGITVGILMSSVPPGDRDEGGAATEALLSLSQAVPRAILAGNDGMALGCFERSAEHIGACSCPEGVSGGPGFNDNEFRAADPAGRDHGAGGQGWARARTVAAENLIGADSTTLTRARTAHDPAGGGGAARQIVAPPRAGAAKRSRSVRA